MTPSKPVIAVDWGSSNRRAYLISQGGSVLERRDDDAGAFSLRTQEYAESLLQLVGDWLDRGEFEIWLSGMVGSRSGWQEAQYVPAPVVLDELAQFALPLLPLPGAGTVRILPGVCQRPPTGEMDVMRGEETQLIGAWRLNQRDGWYVLPGTHSKWVLLHSGRIERFHTVMTGELFARLREKGALAMVTEGQCEDVDAFQAGLAAVRQASLESMLFSIRAGVLQGEFAAATASSRLSGMLIGAEWNSARQFGALEDGEIFLVGSPALTRWYKFVASTLGISATVLDPDACYVQAIASLA